jgi:hypothetical protein
VPALAQIINELKVACVYAEKGCQAEITLSSKYSHEKDCDFRPDVCPHRFVGVVLLRFAAFVDNQFHAYTVLLVANSMEVV